LVKAMGLAAGSDDWRVIFKVSAFIQVRRRERSGEGERERRREGREENTEMGRR
jgi:hypothetical protein